MNRMNKINEIYLRPNDSSILEKKLIDGIMISRQNNEFYRDKNNTVMFIKKNNKIYNTLIFILNIPLDILRIIYEYQYQIIEMDFNIYYCHNYLYTSRINSIYFTTNTFVYKLYFWKDKMDVRYLLFGKDNNVIVDLNTIKDVNNENIRINYEYYQKNYFTKDCISFFNEYSKQNIKTNKHINKDGLCRIIKNKQKLNDTMCMLGILINIAKTVIEKHI